VTRSSLELRGDEVPISVPTLTFRVAGEAYGATRFLVDPYDQPVAVSGGAVNNSFGFGGHNATLVAAEFTR
jgi:hypothetical protein